DVSKIMEHSLIPIDYVDSVYGYRECDYKRLMLILLSTPKMLCKFRDLPDYLKKLPRESGEKKISCHLPISIYAVSQEQRNLIEYPPFLLVERLLTALQPLQNRPDSIIELPPCCQRFLSRAVL